MNKTYHIWTIGCQMNEADSRHVASQLEALGYTATARPEEAGIVILNTCVVRQSAEDKIYGRLGTLQRLKRKRPDVRIALMGCLVGVRDRDKELKERFPHVDYFVAPSDVATLVRHVTGEQAETHHALQDYTLPPHTPAVTAFVPVVLGCSHACAFCVIPSRRGPEFSRPKHEIMDEVRALASQDVREVMLLGQIVDRYGLDLDEDIDLADLLREVAAIPELYRVRFLTSHPNWITDKLIEAVAGEPKVCPQIEIAVQSGNDTVLERMRRGYTGTAYRALIERVRDHIPDAAIHTDVIVGFPGETDEQFMDTYRLMEDVRFDKVHIAKYSERPGTAAAVRFDDNIPAEEKERRRKMLEDLQKKIQTEKAEGLARMTVEVLVEERDRERWRGRTPHNKIVFFEDERDLAGQLVDVKIDWAGPFSLIGKKA
jgi:tRNA-2-methylthio-N6-dimethylallyladenosine synthase